MDNNLEKSVIIYRSEDGTIQLEVQLYNGTVWMNRQQMSTFVKLSIPQREFLAKILNF